MKMSIACATNRKLDHCLKNMINLVALSETPGFEVVVADNSGDQAKSKFFSARASNSLKYLKTQEHTAFLNMLAALNNCTGSVTSFMGDDDLILPLDSFDAQTIQLPDHAIGFRPTILRVNPERGVVDLSTFQVDGGNALERCIDYKRKHGTSENLSFYSFFRTGFLKELYSSFVRYRPEIWTPYDWPMTFGLLSAGSLMQNEKILFFYNDKNWSDPDSTLESRLSFVRRMKLPDNYVVFDNLVNAVDAFVAICHSKPNSSEKEMIDAADYVCGLFFDGFIADFSRNIHALPVEAIPSFNSISEGSLSFRITAAIEAILCLVPSLESQYKLFLSSMLDPRVKRHLSFG